MGTWSNLTNIFQRGWNHQLAYVQMWTLVIVSQNDGTTFVLLIFDWTCSCLQQDAWQGNTMHSAGTLLPRSKVVFEIKSTSKLVFLGIKMSFFHHLGAETTKQLVDVENFVVLCPLRDRPLRGTPDFSLALVVFSWLKQIPTKDQTCLKEPIVVYQIEQQKCQWVLNLPKRLFRVFFFLRGYWGAVPSILRTSIFWPCHPSWPETTLG